MAVVPEWAEGALLADGHEAALIGFGTQFNTPVAVYDYDAAVERLAEDSIEQCEQEKHEECSHLEDAFEWMDFNVLGAWVGPSTPIWVKAPRCSFCHTRRAPLDPSACAACGELDVV